MTRAFCDKLLHDQCACEEWCRDRLPLAPATSPESRGGRTKRYESGMKRSDDAGKTNYLLVRDGPMYERWAKRMSEGAVKFGDRNWMKASSEEDLERIRQSAARHFEAWLRGDEDEDHAAAVMCNLDFAEHVKGKLLR